MADYTISVGDELQLDFLDDQLGAYPLAVGTDGAVQLPFLGTVNLAGLRLLAARETIAQTYIENDILVAPRIDLSVVNLRPISVLGDVQAPGFFDYRPAISVEQAIGLAGGVLRTPGREESRSIQRIALRGELLAIESAMLREATAMARLEAQLAGADRIKVETVQVAGITNPDLQLIATLVMQDEKIIAAEQAHFKAERLLIESAIADVKLQIALTEEQIIAQSEQIASYDTELGSSAELMTQGLTTATARARLLRQVADEETALLRLRTSLAATRREQTGLERELLGLDYRRAQTWRLELAETGVRAAQYRANHASVLDRMALIENWSRRAAADVAGVSLSFVLRRRSSDGASVTLVVDETDVLLPGDILIVRAEFEAPQDATAGQASGISPG